MADGSYMHDADALAQPPAKRARFDGPSREPFERPVTPVDDTDDEDLYGETPVKPSSPLRSLDEDPTSATSLPSSEPLTSATKLALPGLGLLSSAVQQDPGVPELPQANGTTQETPPDDQQHGDYMTGLLQELDSDSPQTAPIPPSVSHAAGTSPKPSPPKTDPKSPESGELPSSADNTAQSTTLSPQAGHVASSQKDTQGITNEGEFRQAAEANKDDENAEWQLDSSADDSSSDSSSDDSSDSSSDEEGEVEDTTLDPEEQARILMENDVDEEPATAEVLRTKNEAEEQYKKPDIAITESMKITELGNVENVVDNLIVIKANISGEYQVLESGSLLCLGDRSVVGVVADTMGRVHAPLYSVGFPDPADIATLGVAKGTTIFYVDDHSTFVFTKPLKAIKGTDASNVHDEETNDVEFSDDEAEAEYKRGLKRAKQARADSRRDAEPEQGRPVRRDSPPANPIAVQQHQGGGLNYSDEEEDMGMYKPLTRPDHFEDIVGAGAPIEDRSHVRRNGPGRMNRGMYGPGTSTGVLWCQFFFGATGGVLNTTRIAIQHLPRPCREPSLTRPGISIELFFERIDLVSWLRSNWHSK
ncbi:NAF1-domain-containing protein [Lophium mytilinum]|uniref:H/ACA ribonucleoprotein complex non-core subunit NAF1 n=1 Tax=Lophium mytilinum TaxID=390894 RepID=A0A6A6QUC5_9PEZI|nr:NAF1-domain-containing protein [Lophium mytilinum]